MRYRPNGLKAALGAAFAADGLTDAGVARAARARGHKLYPSHVQAVRSGTTRNPRLDTLLAILDGMGRDLGWLARALNSPEPEPQRTA